MKRLECGLDLRARLEIPAPAGETMLRGRDEMFIPFTGFAVREEQARGNSVLGLSSLTKSLICCASSGRGAIMGS